jgi:hypothetical protein
MTVVDYQTRDGLDEFGFSVEFQSNTGWRVYIIFEPFTWSDGQEMNLPYQSVDHEGRRYVNWSSKIDTLGEARTVAEIWAELVQRTQRERAIHVELMRRQSPQQRQEASPTTRPKTVRNTSGAGRGHPERSLDADCCFQGPKNRSLHPDCSPGPSAAGELGHDRAAERREIAGSPA